MVTDRRVVFVGVSVCARSKGETAALPAALQRTGLRLSNSCSCSGRHTTALQVGNTTQKKKRQTHISLTARWHSLSLCLALSSLTADGEVGSAEEQTRNDENEI